MRSLFAFVCVGTALLLSACADQSLMTDEEYYARKNPAPHSPDFSGALPRPVNPATGRPY